MHLIRRPVVSPKTHRVFTKTYGFTPSLSITDGNIYANGSEDERITFSPFDDDSNDYHILIDGNDENISLFNNVDFVGGGKARIEGESVPLSFWQIFMNTAHAQTNIVGEATLQITQGMIHILNSKFKNGNYYAIESEMFIGTRPDNTQTLVVENTDFVDSKNNFAIKSTFECSEGAYKCYGRIIFKNNWYDSADGPKTDEHLERSGELVSGFGLVNGWSIVPHFPEASNVLFLPGLKASRLYGDVESTCAFDDDNNKLAWEPNCNDDVRWLYLDEDGKSINTINTKTGDIVDETPIGSDVYKSFIEKMNEMKNTDKTINDWKPIAYDWRLSLDDILEDGSMENIINELAASSKTKKVTIVAHSNGGLLAKALMQKLGNDEAKRLVDKIIFVAVPQVGTPAAIAGLLHAEGQAFFPVLDKETARGFGENMPGAYNLIPSEKYFSTVQTPVVEFKTQQSDDWRDLFDEKINSKSGLHTFLADDFRRVPAIDSDVNIPAKLNEKLLENAEETHENLDAWTVPDGVKLIQIAGWGVPKTLSSTEYGTQRKTVCNGLSCQFWADYLDPDFKFTIDGDGTVVSPSALWMSGVERYWVDLGKYNKNHPFSTAFGFNSMEHKNILEISEVLDIVNSIIVNKYDVVLEYISNELV